MPRSEPRPFLTLGLLLVVALAVAGCAQQAAPQQSTDGDNATGVGDNSTNVTGEQVFPGIPDNSTAGQGNTPVVTP